EAKTVLKSCQSIVKAIVFPIVVARVGTGLFSTLTSILSASRVHRTRYLRVPPRTLPEGGPTMNAAILQKETEIERAVLDVAQPGQDYRPLDLVKLVVANRGNADWNQ